MDNKKGGACALPRLEKREKHLVFTGGLSSADDTVTVVVIEWPIYHRFIIT